MKTEAKLETKLSNNVEVSNVARVPDGAVKAQHEQERITTTMQHSFMHPTA